MVHPLDKPVDALEEADILTLIQFQVSEARRIEYKKCLPGNGDGERKEFYSDVSSFANAQGGLIFYGVDTKNGVPVAADGVAVPDVDGAKLALEGGIRTGIDPRIAGLQIRPIELKNGNSVIVIQVPRSWYGPHMVTFKDSNKFYTRGGNGKYPMDIQEIRRAFANSNISAQLKRFRQERVSLILDGHIPSPMAHPSSVIVHLVPFSALTESASIDIVRVRKAHNAPPILDASLPVSLSASSRFNLDGLLAMGPIGASQVMHCTQLFRNGTMEAIEGNSLGTPAEPVILHRFLEPGCIVWVAKSLALLEREGIVPPIALFVTLTRVRGFRLDSGGNRPAGLPVDRDHLELPEVILETIPRDLDEVLDVMTPVFDALWNACGYPGWLDKEVCRKSAQERFRR